MNQPLSGRDALQLFGATTLILVIILTTSGTWETNQSNSALQQRRDQLQLENGPYRFFENEDPSKFRIMRLPSEDRYHFRWQFQSLYSVRLRIVESVGFHPTLPEESLNILPAFKDALLQIDFQIDDHQTSFCFDHGYPSSQEQWQIRDPLIIDLLRNHWDELEFEIAGDTQLAEFPNHRNFTLLRVRAPDHLLSDLRFSPEEEGTFLLIRVGNVAAFEQEKVGQSQREGDHE